MDVKAVAAVVVVSLMLAAVTVMRSARERLAPLRARVHRFRS